MAKNIKKIQVPGVTEPYDVIDATAIHKTDVATSTKAGIVKIGSGITVAVDGTISVNATAPVTSVNSKTGEVVLTADDVGAVSKTGGTMTGDLTVGSASLQTNGYVTGTWLKTTGDNALNKVPTKIAVLDGGWVYSRTPAQIKSDIGLGSVDNVKQYSASNPPPYPVTSVNGQTGAVTLETGGETNIVVSRTQPSGQKAGDFWFQIVD